MALAREVTMDVDTTSFEQSIDEGFRDLARLRQIVGMPVKRYTVKARAKKFNRAYGAIRNRFPLSIARNMASRRQSVQSQYFDPFPQQMRAILRYNEGITLPAPLPGQFSTTYYRANSIYDPRAAVGGHQPYGHDIYQSIYNHYRVDKAVIRVNLGGVGVFSIVGVGLQDDQTTLGNIDSIFEQKTVKRAVLATTGSQNPYSVSCTYDRLKTFVNNESNIQANFGSDPSEQQFFAIYLRALEPVDTPQQSKVFISIDYYVTMWEPRDLGLS